MDEQELHERNRRVEADKAWETSFTRKFLIAVVTYLVVGFYLSLLGISTPWLHALVPPAAYVLSTLSLGFIKTLWIKHLYKKKQEDIR